MDAERRVQQDLATAGTPTPAGGVEGGAPPLRAQLRGLDYEAGSAALRPPGGPDGQQTGDVEGGKTDPLKAKIDKAEAALVDDPKSGWGRVLAECHGVDVRENNIPNPLSLKQKFPGMRVSENPHSPCLRDEWGLAYQCVEFVNRYYALRLGHKNMVGTGNAKDYLGEGDRGLETHYNNGPTRPQAGDLMVSVTGGGGFGHVGIVRSVSAGAIEVAQQNAGAGNAIKRDSLQKTGGGWRIGDGSYWRGFRRKPGAAPVVSADPATPSDDSAPAENPDAAGGATYTVRRGDTLSAIAERFGVPGGYRELARLNGIANPSVIHAGQVLRLPGAGPASPAPAVAPADKPAPDKPAPDKPAADKAPAESATFRYTVVAGDTLSAIALRFGVAGGYRALARLNGIANPSVISVGLVLRVPRA